MGKDNCHDFKRFGDNNPSSYLRKWKFSRIYKSPNILEILLRGRDQIKLVCQMHSKPNTGMPRFAAEFIYKAANFGRYCKNKSQIPLLKGGELGIFMDEEYKVVISVKKGDWRWGKGEAISVLCRLHATSWDVCSKMETLSLI